MDAITMRGNIHRSKLLKNITFSKTLIIFLSFFCIFNLLIYCPMDKNHHQGYKNCDKSKVDSQNAQYRKDICF